MKIRLSPLELFLPAKYLVCPCNSITHGFFQSGYHTTKSLWQNRESNTRHTVQEAMVVFRSLRVMPLYHMFERKINRQSQKEYSDWVNQHHRWLNSRPLRKKCTVEEVSFLSRAPYGLIFQQMDIEYDELTLQSPGNLMAFILK